MEPFLIRVDGSCRYLQREMHSSTCRIRTKLKLEAIAHQNTAQFAVFEKNGEDRGIAV